MKKLLVGVVLAVSLVAPVRARAAAPVSLSIVTTGDPSTYDWSTYDGSTPLPWSFAWSNLPPGLADGCGPGCTIGASPVALFTVGGVEYVNGYNEGAPPEYQNYPIPVSVFGSEADAIAANSGPNVTGVGTGDAWWQYCCPSGTFPSADQVTYSYGLVSVDGVGGSSGGGDLVGAAFASSGSTLATYVGLGVGVIVAALSVAVGVGLLVRYLRKGVRAA